MKLKRAVYVSFLFVILIGKDFGQTAFKNLITMGMNPEPNISRVGDDFYLVTSTFGYLNVK
jgi:beta-xylosidase